MTRPDRLSGSVLLAVLTIAVLSAGCVALSGGESSGTATAFEEDVETAEPPTTVTATLELTIEADGERETLTEPVWLRADGASRIGDRDAGSEYVRVDDGDRVWQYDPDADAVTVRDSNATDTHYLSFTYAELDRHVEEYAISAAEETTVDGRDAYRVAFDPPADETIERSISIAVGDTEYVLPLETSDIDESEYAEHVELHADRDRLFPLRFHVESDGVELTMEYTDVTFGEEIPDDRFAFEPPESATVETERPPEYLAD